MDLSAEEEGRSLWEMETLPEVPLLTVVLVSRCIGLASQQFDVLVFLRSWGLLVYEPGLVFLVF